MGSPRELLGSRSIRVPRLVEPMHSIHVSLGDDSTSYRAHVVDPRHALDGSTPYRALDAHTMVPRLLEAMNRIHALDGSTPLRAHEPDPRPR